MLILYDLATFIEQLWGDPCLSPQAMMKRAGPYQPISTNMRSIFIVVSCL